MNEWFNTSARQFSCLRESVHIKVFEFFLDSMVELVVEYVYVHTYGQKVADIQTDQFQDKNFGVALALNVFLGS